MKYSGCLVFGCCCEVGDSIGSGLYMWLVLVGVAV